MAHHTPWTNAAMGSFAWPENKGSRARHLKIVQLLGLSIGENEYQPAQAQFRERQHRLMQQEVAWFERARSMTGAGKPCIMC